MIGRKKEIERIERLLASERSEFLAVTGRRRVGKTFLIDTLLKEYYCFSITGVQNGSLTTQLVNFAAKLSEYDGTNQMNVADNWQIAFLNLKTYLKTLDKDRKQVIFMDELPWMDTPKSGLIQILAHFWNDYLSKEKHFILVICGSATSWITQKIMNDAGGLHNRVTENIHLYAFTLPETDLFFKSRGMQFSLHDLAKIYMALGGIPFYLENIRKGESFGVAIERICYAPTGILYNEYKNLFQALFNNSDIHQKITEVLASRPNGLSHAQIVQSMGLKQTTGSYQRAMEELIISDFVVENTSFGKKKRDATYRLTDEYCIFYYHFIKPHKKYSVGMWQQMAESPSYKIWAGYAFETLCHKHIDAIKNVLGISAVYTEIYYLRVPTSETTEGFQIDLLIDRKDNSINLCEIKFHSAAFTITKDYKEQLVEKRQRFLDYTGTKKQVFLTFITNCGIKTNAYSQEIVDVAVCLEDLI